MSGREPLRFCAVPPPRDFSKRSDAELEVIARENDQRFVSLLALAFRRGDHVAATCAFSPCVTFDCGWCLIKSTLYRYAMTGEGKDLQFKPARVMPAALAPFVLRITEVKAERPAPH